MATLSVVATAPEPHFDRARARTDFCCSRCGALIDGTETMVKRGALTMTRDPIEVRWFGQFVALSPGEAHLFAAILTRGRLSFERMDEALEEFGVRRQNRSILIYRIRRKFQNLGASDPFEPLGNLGLRLRVDADETDPTGVWIGRRSA